MLCNTEATAERWYGPNTKASCYSASIRNIMSTVVKISSELRAWIDHNLNRGCVPEQLIEGMIVEKFEPAVARGLVEAFVQAPAAGTPVAGDTLPLNVATSAYGGDLPRIAPGNGIRTTDRTITVLLRVTRP